MNLNPRLYGKKTSVRTKKLVDKHRKRPLAKLRKIKREVPKIQALTAEKPRG